MNNHEGHEDKKLFSVLVAKNSKGCLFTTTLAHFKLKALLPFKNSTLGSNMFEMIKLNWIYRIIIILLFAATLSIYSRSYFSIVKAVKKQILEQEYHTIKLAANVSQKAFDDRETESVLEILKQPAMNLLYSILFVLLSFVGLLRISYHLK